MEVNSFYIPSLAVLLSLCLQNFVYEKNIFISDPDTVYYNSK